MDLSSYQQQMDKAVSYLQTELKSIQVGSASPVMLENVHVQTSYGSMKIPQLAHVVVVDTKTIKVEAWDKKELKNIEKAIYDAKLGLVPQNEGEYLYIKVPELTKERRQEIAKQVKTSGEDTKAQLRKARQDGMKDTKHLFEEKEISEDEHKNNEMDIDTLTKKMNQNIDEIVEEKVAVILAV